MKRTGCVIGISCINSAKISIYLKAVWLLGSTALIEFHTFCCRVSFMNCGRRGKIVSLFRRKWRWQDWHPTYCMGWSNSGVMWEGKVVIIVHFSNPQKAISASISPSSRCIFDWMNEGQRARCGTHHHGQAHIQENRNKTRLGQRGLVRPCPPDVKALLIVHEMLS